MKVLWRMKTLLQPVFASGLAYGQSNVASITDIITDPSGAVVPRADVVISNNNTGIEYRTTTNEASVYVAPSLIIGPYLGWRFEAFNAFNHVNSFGPPVQYQRRQLWFDHWCGAWPADADRSAVVILA